MTSSGFDFTFCLFSIYSCEKLFPKEELQSTVMDRGILMFP